MPSHAVSPHDSEGQGDQGDRLPIVWSKAPKLPVSEILFDRAGAPAPFGDDRWLPLPVSELTYVHPAEDAFPQHL